MIFNGVSFLSDVVIFLLYIMCIHSLSCWVSFPCRQPQSPEWSSPSCAVDFPQLSILSTVSVAHICQSRPPSSSHSSLPLGVHTCVLCVWVSIYNSVAGKIIYTILLDFNVLSPSVMSPCNPMDLSHIYAL